MAMCDSYQKMQIDFTKLGLWAIAFTREGAARKRVPVVSAKTATIMARPVFSLFLVSFWSVIVFPRMKYRGMMNRSCSTLNIRLSQTTWLAIITPDVDGSSPMR